MVLALEAGHQVRAVIRNMDQAEKLQTHQGVRAHSSQLEFFPVSDLTRPSEFDIILKDVTGVLHLASPLAVEVDSTFVVNLEKRHTD
jgi:nucleoside-diphosphate-sugar epimerase